MPLAPEAAETQAISRSVDRADQGRGDHCRVGIDDPTGLICARELKDGTLPALDGARRRGESALGTTPVSAPVHGVIVAGELESATVGVGDVEPL